MAAKNVEKTKSVENEVIAEEKTTKKEVCAICKGTGTILLKAYKRDFYHRKELIESEVKCPKCGV